MAIIYVYELPKGDLTLASQQQGYISFEPTFSCDFYSLHLTAL